MFTAIIAAVGKISRVESAKGGLRPAVDGGGKVTRFEPAGKSRLLSVRAPSGLARYIARKGSVTVHGVSLTVNAARGAEFEVNLIPHTLAVTTLRYLEVGDRVNLEVDPLARYAERLLGKK